MVMFHILCFTLNPPGVSYTIKLNFTLIPIGVFLPSLLNHQLIFLKKGAKKPTEGEGRFDDSRICFQYGINVRSPYVDIYIF